ncbi:MAG: hypothetical protein ACRCXX_11245 [Cetobacterium sp.]|uniref:hypothetical protein n=1 Tax=Cetobacterium sp. TaxID=2071632 RepID=UPI003F3F4A41
MFSLLFTSTFAFNIGIAPTGFYTSLDKNETHEIMVTNNTVYPMRIVIGRIEYLDEVFKKEVLFGEVVVDLEKKEICL